MPQILPFFLILLVGLLFSELFRRLHLPWVIALLVGGMLIGPSGFDWFTPNETIQFIGQIGLIFMMFMAGLETRLSTFQQSGKGVSLFAFFNGAIPFFVGMLIALAFGYPPIVALLIGIMFISSAIAVVIPSLEANNLLGTNLGRTVTGGTIIADIMSLLLLSLFLHQEAPLTILPAPLLYVFLLIALVVLRWAIPRLRWMLVYRYQTEKDLFEQEIRVIFVILLGVVLFFELVGLHPIIAAFFAGLVLSESIKSEFLKQKLHAMSYGLFIPVFFIVIGAETNLLVFGEVGTAFAFTAAIILGSIVSKLGSGWLSGKVLGFNSYNSFLMGAATLPQLSMALAVVFAGQELGLLDDQIVVAIIALSIVTTFLGPMLMTWGRKAQERREEQALQALEE